MKNKSISNDYPKIGPWAASTITAPKKDIVEECYINWLKYKIIHEGTISRELADSWGASKLFGSKFSCLEPESGNKFVLRVIEYSQPEDYVPLTTYGWNASELVVRNTDDLEKKLLGSPFKIIGRPADLQLTKEIRAMQVEGLAKEVFYLTMFKEKIPKYDLPEAMSDIDLMFIAVLATDKPEKVQNWYLENFGIPVRKITKTNIKVLDQSFGLEKGAGSYGLTVIPLEGKSLIEVDEYPREAKNRSFDNNSLPPGNAMMSVYVDSIEGLLSLKIARPIVLSEPPYSESRSITAIGAAGELIEFIERKNS